MAPFDLRDRLIEQIRLVATAAEAGERARIRIKVNALTDPRVIEALYSASASGASIELVVRSICSLRPGVEGLSENIRVRSVLGRFLPSTVGCSCSGTETNASRCSAAPT